MNLRMSMRRAARPEELSLQQYEIGIVGAPVDGRGEMALERVRKCCKRVVQMTFEPETGSLVVDGETVQVDEFHESFANSRGPVLLEATTLGFVEIAIASRTLQDVGILEQVLLYVEPGGYFLPDPRQILHARDFSLTDAVTAYTGVPGWIKRIDQARARVIFLLGFEGQRLAQAVEQLPLNPRRCSVLFGVPAYRPGWELNAFANNIPVLQEHAFRGGVDFCAADNPLAVVELLQSKYQSFSSSQDIFIVPIGTKPHGIGAALFAAMNRNIGIFYDHPSRRMGRSTETASWHSFSISFKSA